MPVWSLLSVRAHRGLAWKWHFSSISGEVEAEVVCAVGPEVVQPSKVGLQLPTGQLCLEQRSQRQRCPGELGQLQKKISESLGAETAGSGIPEALGTAASPVHPRSQASAPKIAAPQQTGAAGGQEGRS